jgi:hypothetical protein
MNVIEQELQLILPFNSEVPVPPFTPEMSIEDKIRVAQKALRRSIELRNRLTSLINAFYLGQAINEADTVSAKFKNKQKVSKHYATMAEYIYDIFEPDPSQIYQTLSLTIQQVRKLKKKEVLKLRSIIEENIQPVFGGAQN